MELLIITYQGYVINILNTVFQILYFKYCISYFISFHLFVLFSLDATKHKLILSVIRAVVSQIICHQNGYQYKHTVIRSSSYKYVHMDFFKLSSKWP